jgi:hypothetical protein
LRAAALLLPLISTVSLLPYPTVQKFIQNAGYQP